LAVVLTNQTYKQLRQTQKKLKKINPTKSSKSWLNSSVASQHIWLDA